MLTAILGVLIVVALALGLLAGFALQSKREKTKLESADADAARILSEAQTKEKELLLEAKAGKISSYYSEATYTNTRWIHEAVKAIDGKVENKQALLEALKKVNLKE